MRLPYLLRGLLLAAVAGSAAAAIAQGTGPAPERLRIVGGLAGVNQYKRHEEPFWTRSLPTLTQGRASAEIVPFDRAGLRGQEMVRLVQIGAVPFGTLLLSLSAAQEPELIAPDLAGLNPDFATLQRNLGAYRPRLAAMLHERYGIELLAVYVYPAQVTFCKTALSSLADLAGRRVRISSSSQADLVSALGGAPVQTAFAEIVPNLRNGNIDCAITGTMSGNTIGLHEVTTHIHTMPISWGLAAFVANGAAWGRLSDRLKRTLLTELPRLEARIWDESERETLEGIACNTGAPGCTSGRMGRMTLVRDNPADQRRRQELLVSAVLPAWVRRCGPTCAQVWRETLGPATGIELR